MKTLFLGLSDLNDYTGGSMCSRRNYECLCQVVGKENVDIVILKQYTERKSYFSHMIWNKTTFHSIEEYNVEYSKYGLLFIDSCLLSSSLKKLRKGGFKGKVIVFFHNCEYDFQNLVRPSATITGKIVKAFFLHAVKYQESYALKRADMCIFLNERDLKRELELYHIKPHASLILPMSIGDKFDDSFAVTGSNTSGKPLYTLLGSFFPPNVEGAKWFVENVLPYVDIRFQIIGKDMHKLKDLFDCSGVEIYSNVLDLKPYLLKTDYMLFPIFDGSGMKVKTCESLMYGKNIVGTPEAFSGYMIDDYSKVGACCSSASEFISAIKSLDMPRYNLHNRNLYKEHFSYESSIKLLKNGIDNL